MATPAASKRRGAPKKDTRGLILDTTERLMLEEGYGAVSTRRVGKEIGVKPSLVHYYFPTTDDLFVALFRRGLERQQAAVDAARDSEHPLQALWATYCNREQTALAVEFLALANHRKALQEEIARVTASERQRRADILGELLEPGAVQPEGCSTHGLNVLLTGIARTMVMEQRLGIDTGHADARAFVEYWLARVEKQAD